MAKKQDILNTQFSQYINNLRHQQMAQPSQQVVFEVGPDGQTAIRVNGVNGSGTLDAKTAKKMAKMPATR